MAKKSRRERKLARAKEAKRSKAASIVTPPAPRTVEVPVPVPKPSVAQLTIVAPIEADEEAEVRAPDLRIQAAEIDCERLLDIAIARMVSCRQDREELIKFFQYCVTFQDALDRLRPKIRFMLRDIREITGIVPCHQDGEPTAIMLEVWELFRKRVRRGALDKIIQGRLPLLSEQKKAA